MLFAVDLVDIRVDNAPEVIGGWAIVAMISLLCGALSGWITSFFDKKLVPIASALGTGIGFILSLAIKISIGL